MDYQIATKNINSFGGIMGANTALAAQSVPITLLISDEQTTTGNVSFNEYVTIMFLAEGMINTADDTITIYSPANIIAQPTKQIFSGAGTVSFGKGGILYPNWWGLNATPGATDMGTAIQAAIDSCDGAEVHFLGEEYLFATGVTLTSDVSLIGTKQTILNYSGTGDAITPTRNTYVSDLSQQSIIRDFTLKYSGATATSRGIVGDEWSGTLENIRIRYFGDAGISLDFCLFVTINDCWLEENGTGLKILGTTAAEPGGQTLVNNIFVRKSATNGIVLDNAQTVLFNAGTVSGTVNGPSIQALGSSRIKFSHTFVEPALGDDRTYWTNLVEVKENSGDLSCFNIEFDGCYLYSGQAGSTARYDYAIWVNDTKHLVIKNCFFNLFQAVAIYLDYEDYAVYDYDIRDNHYYLCAAEFTRVSSQGIRFENNVYQTRYITHEFYQSSLVFNIAAFTADDATPSVKDGRLFRTANVNPTTITALDDGTAGQEIKILINDANTTIDFTGTTLKGNAGIDWTPTTGDWMECFMYGSNWYCSVHDTTA